MIDYLCMGLIRILTCKRMVHGWHVLGDDNMIEMCEGIIRWLSCRKMKIHFNNFFIHFFSSF